MYDLFCLVHVSVKLLDRSVIHTVSIIFTFFHFITEKLDYEILWIYIHNTAGGAVISVPVVANV